MTACTKWRLRCKEVNGSLTIFKKKKKRMAETDCLGIEGKEGLGGDY